MNIRDRLNGLLWQLGCSSFVGIILVAIAAGAVFPALDRLAAAPLVCPDGRFVVHQDTYSYRPGEIDVMTTDLCVNSRTGAQADVSTLTLVVSGVVYSLVIFFLSIIVPPIARGVKKLTTSTAT